VSIDLGRFLVRDDRDYMAELGTLDSKGYLASVSSLEDQVWDSMINPRPGLLLPWESARWLVSSELGRWTVVSGKSFSGKTNFLRQWMLHAINSGEKTLFCSLEEDPYEVLKEAVYMAALQRKNVPRSFLQWCVDLWQDKLWIFNHSGFIDPFIVLGAACYAARELGVTRVVVDSLMKLDIRKDDWDGQRQLANTIDRVCRRDCPTARRSPSSRVRSWVDSDSVLAMPISAMTTDRASMA
jgi:hypothetical protein